MSTSPSHTSLPNGAALAQVEAEQRPAAKR
jgi:hypothetical protein